MSTTKPRSECVSVQSDQGFCWSVFCMTSYKKSKALISVCVQYWYSGSVTIRLPLTYHTGWKRKQQENLHITPDKRGYPDNIFLVSPLKPQPVKSISTTHFRGKIAIFFWWKKCLIWSYEFHRRTYHANISQRSRQKSKLSALRCCGPPDELLPEPLTLNDSSSLGPQHQGADTFDSHLERYDIDVLLPNSHD